jgi:hypothetical protein
VSFAPRHHERESAGILFMDVKARIFGCALN